MDRQRSQAIESLQISSDSGKYQRCDIFVPIVLTYSSLANGFAKYTFKKDIDFNVLKSLDKAICLAEQNRKKSVINHILVLTFTTLIDVVNCDYKAFSFMIHYPVKKINNEYEADADRFKI